MLGQLAREAKRDPLKYSEFYNEFGSYIKEGACTGTSLSSTLSLSLSLSLSMLLLVSRHLLG
eukprot:COSAG04_NODE_1213_length_7716_cov_4.100565_5_plen_62_part_00